MSAGVVFINVEEGLQRVMNNKMLYVRLLKKFRDDTKLEGLVDAINSGDLTVAREKAHTIKGIAANLSLTKLFLETQELELKIKDGIADKDMMANIQVTFDETIAQIQKVIEENGSAN
jgi:HPt (histidine-containing phosphotransfer) domain-containing protein